MKPEKRYLIHDLLAEQHDIRREATLLAGGRILRRRRWRRRGIQTLAAVTFMAFAALSLQRLVPPSAPTVTAVLPPSAPPVQSLTDAELLALFSDMPVGLITLENGKKRLVFPRPGDEERFVKRL
jgi:hypothetical protein